MLARLVCGQDGELQPEPFNILTCMQQKGEKGIRRTKTIAAVHHELKKNQLSLELALLHLNASHSSGFRNLKRYARGGSLPVQKIALIILLFSFSLLQFRDVFLLLSIRESRDQSITNCLV